MKTSSWKWTGDAAPDQEKTGLYVDDVVYFATGDNEPPQRLQVVVALLLAMDFVATQRPFTLTDEQGATWLSCDGQRVNGPESLQMAIVDLSALVDHLRQRYFASRVEYALQLAQEQARRAAEEAAQNQEPPTAESVAVEPVEPSAGTPD